MGDDRLRQGAAERFRAEFGGEPRWISSAPGRVNLIGEHLDYVEGQVLPAAIDRFIAMAGAPGPEWTVSSDVEGGRAYLEAIGRDLGVPPQRVAVAAGLPPGRGLGSSAAFLVAAAAGLRPRMGGVEAAVACRRAEQAVGPKVGIMDQFAVALGRADHAVLLDCATLEHRHVPFPGRIVVAAIDSGIERRLAETGYDRRRQEAERAVRAHGGRLDQISDAGGDRRLRHLVTEVRRVREFVEALEAEDLPRLGRLLDASHASLRDDFEVSVPALDRLVERARGAPGCLGARIMGAGFGGSALALVERGAEARFQRSLGAPVMFCRPTDGAFVR
ncbi:MAG: galactokinase [Candidatus Dormibacteraceae bacterium]